jgi:phosphate transport system protein
MQALVERDEARADAVIRMDDEVDQLQKEIDAQCSRMLALQQPMATDLRFLVATMKIATDLERMGDSAVNVAQAVAELDREPPLKPYIDLPRLAQIAQEMVRDALDSFVRRDARAALDVCKRDDEVDALYQQLFREMVTFMAEDREEHHAAPCTCCSSRATTSASPITPPTSARTSSSSSRAATSAT